MAGGGHEEAFLTSSARGRCQRGFPQEHIRDSRVGSAREEQALQRRQPHVSIDEECPQPLLSEGHGVAGGRETFAFTRHGAGEEEAAAFLLRNQERKGGPK